MVTRDQFIVECQRIIDGFNSKDDMEGLREWMRYMVRHNIFFLALFVCEREDFNRDWLYDRCQEVQAHPDGFIDIWAREHYKSSIITWLKTMQDILINPEERICIYSFNQTLAKSFVNQVKTEFETNWRLKWLFPEILWEDPLKGTYLDEDNVRQRIPWTTDSIRVKRKSRAKEDTLTASGLVTGQKTGGHYTILIYDDVVTLDSVTSAEIIDRTTKAYEMSLNTGSSSGGKPTRVRIIGTRYHYADTYSVILKRGSAKPRIYPCVDERGDPVLLTKEILADKKKDLGSWVFASQMMCDPRQAGSMGFKREWIKPWTPTIWENLNRVIVVDPADKVKRKTDYTTMWVVGLGADRNYYVIDLIRDKLSLTGRTNALFALHQKYRPNLGVHYESVGMQADTQHIEEQMELRNYRFPLYPVKATVAKGLRIEALEPLFRNHRVYMPEAIWWKNWEGETVNLVEQFILEEFLAYPFCSHDDMLDGLSKIVDEQVVPFLYFPEPLTAEELLKQRLGIPTDYEEPYEPF
jgi:predicted phage terminase large subunit-like protein